MRACVSARVCQQESGTPGQTFSWSEKPKSVFLRASIDMPVSGYEAGMDVDLKQPKPNTRAVKS